MCAVHYAVVNSNFRMLQLLLKSKASVLEYCCAILVEISAAAVDGNIQNSGEVSSDKDCQLIAKPNIAECIDYSYSDMWLSCTKLYFNIDNSEMCRRLVNFRLREELRSVSNRFRYTVKQAPTNLQENGISANESVNLSKGSTTAAAAVAAAQRQQRRKDIRECKLQVKVAKEQNAVEVEREAQKLRYLKKIEKEYTVSFKGLFA